MFKIITLAVIGLAISTPTKIFAESAMTPQKSGFGYNGFFIESLIKSPIRSAQRETIRQVLEDTGASFIRFPGGTRGNEFVPILENTGLGKQTKFDKGFTKNFIVEYAETVKGFKTKTVYVANIAAHFPNYYGSTIAVPKPLRNKTDQEIISMNVRAVEYLLDQGLDVPFVELGNELYAYDLSKLLRGKVRGQKDVTKVIVAAKPVLDRYTQLVDQYTKAFDALAERKSKELGRPIVIMTGVPAITPSEKINPNYNNYYQGDFSVYFDYWNSRVAQMNTDAAIIHPYADTSACIKNKSAAESLPSCLSRTAYADLQGLPNVLDRVQTIFAGKQIWVTEYNVALGFSSNDVRAKSSYVASPEHLDYLARVSELFSQRGIPVYLAHQFYSASARTAVINNGTTSAIVQKNVCAYIPKFMTTKREQYQCK